jgi:hypothetical protein
VKETVDWQQSKQCRSSTELYVISLIMSSRWLRDSGLLLRLLWPWPGTVILSYVFLDRLSGCNPVASDLLAPDVPSADEKAQMAGGETTQLSSFSQRDQLVQAR